MSVQFYCPNCDALIAYSDDERGRQINCLSCGQLLIAPATDDEKPRIPEPEPEILEPLPGFYHAVFINSWKIFVDWDNITSLVFVIAVVCFKFFSAGSCCCAYVVHYAVWGWLFGFYLNIIYETALSTDKLPEIYLGTILTFVWYVIKPFLIFIYTLCIVQLPFIIASALLNHTGITPDNMWEQYTGFHLLLQGLFVFGLFLFPMAILTASIGKDITLLRPDYFLRPVFKAFLPYVVVAVLLVAAGVSEIQTSQYSGAGFSTTAVHLAINLAVQALAIIAMRSIGLFYRHYRCHLSW